MMVAIAIMIGSFRETVIYWVGQTLQADLFVSPGSRRQPGLDETLSPEVVRIVAASPDVAAVDRFRMAEVAYGDTGVRVGGAEFDVVLTHGSLLFKAPADARAAMRGAIGQDAVVASEAFSLKHGVGVGDTMHGADRRGPCGLSHRGGLLRLLERPRRPDDGPRHVRTALRGPRGQAA